MALKYFTIEDGDGRVFSTITMHKPGTYPRKRAVELAKLHTSQMTVIQRHSDGSMKKIVSWAYSDGRVVRYAG
jgi:hypothetical protein